MRILPAAALALAVPCLGFTDCNYFSRVVVPMSDATPPIAYVGIWTPSGGYESLSQFGPVDHALRPGEGMLAFGVVSDAGGARELRIAADEEIQCCSGSTCQVVNPALPFVETQPGGPGATVSNGIWNGTWIDFPTCPNGMTLRSFYYRWSATGTDFFGNAAPRSAWGVIHYP